MRRRRLSQLLKDLRRKAGITATQAAEQLGWDPAKVSRIERNEWKLPNPRDVRDLLDLYGVTDEKQREMLLDLAKQARQRGWWNGYRDVFKTALPDFEAGATAISIYGGLLVPGLLQTADYAAAVWRGGQVLEEELVKRHVQARLARQEILHRPEPPPPTLVALIDEAALCKTVGGPACMAGQLRHLADMAARPNITIQVVPNDAGAHAALTGGFAILDFPGEEGGLAYVETATDILWREGEEHQRYRLIFDRVMNAAFSPGESLRHIQEKISHLRGRDICTRT